MRISARSPCSAADMTGAEAWHVPRLPLDDRCGVRSDPKDSPGATTANHHEAGEQPVERVCLPRIVWIDGCSCLISQAECWVSNSRKSYPASARIDTSTFCVTVVPTTVLPNLMASLMAFIWRQCLPQY